MERSQHVRHLTDALATLLNAPDLNLDELEPETIAAIEQARETFAMVRDGLNRFRVRYARIVVMETDVLAASADDIAHMALPGVYEGVPTDHIPSHVQDVTKYDPVWEFREL